MIDLLNTLQGIFSQSHGTGILLIPGIMATYWVYRICQRLCQNGGDTGACKAGIFSIMVITVVCLSLMTLVLLNGGILSSSPIPLKMPTELKAP